MNKSLYILLFGLIIFLQGCQITGNFENKAEPSQKSFINNSKSVVKKPQYAPYDWKPSDVNSREVWFEKKFAGYWCEVFFSTGGWKSVFLRNGNVIT